MPRRRAQISAVAAAVLALAVTVVYWLVISAQDDTDLRRPKLVAGSLILASSCLLASAAVREPRLRLSLRALGSALLLVWTILGALSIGILLLPATVLAVASTVRAAAELPNRAAWATTGTAAALALALVATILNIS
jgi:hypothetical protein